MQSGVEIFGCESFLSVPGEENGCLLSSKLGVMIIIIVMRVHFSEAGNLLEFCQLDLTSRSRESSLSSLSMRDSSLVDMETQTAIVL